MRYQKPIGGDCEGSWLARLGIAKRTDTGKARKVWAMEIYESHLPKLEPVADKSFASELHREASHWA